MDNTFSRAASLFPALYSSTSLLTEHLFSTAEIFFFIVMTDSQKAEHLPLHLIVFPRIWECSCPHAGGKETTILRCLKLIVQMNDSLDTKFLKVSHGFIYKE